MEVNSKPILLKDSKAVKLAKERAILEGRSASNAAAITIVEALSPEFELSPPPKPRMKKTLSIKEAAEKLGVTARHTRRMCQGGRIKGAYKAGRRWQIAQR